MALFPSGPFSTIGLNWRCFSRPNTDIYPAQSRPAQIASMSPGIHWKVAANALGALRVDTSLVYRRTQVSTNNRPLHTPINQHRVCLLHYTSFRRSLKRGRYKSTTAQFKDIASWVLSNASRRAQKKGETQDAETQLRTPQSLSGAVSNRGMGPNI